MGHFERKIDRMIMKYIGNLIRYNYSKFENWREYSNSRKQALQLKKKVVEKKGYSDVDHKTLKRIKFYSKEVFGSSDYWPWLALYTEISGEFKEGWVPDDYYSFEMIPNFNPKSISMLSTLKSFDHRIFNNFSLMPLGLKISNSFFTPTFERISYSDFKKILSDHNDEVVIKRDGGPSGKEIVFKFSDEVDVSDFKHGESYVIQPVAKQHKSINKLYDKSINTVRVATLITNSSGIKVVLVMMRFGFNGSRIDNVMSGGRFLNFDENGNAYPNSFDELGLNAGFVHPDTGFVFKNLKIPSFSETLTKCKEAHMLFPYVRFIAWDVFIDENGKPKILEWNARKPGMWRYEATLGPLWNRLNF